MGFSCELVDHKLHNHTKDRPIHTKPTNELTHFADTRHTLYLTPAFIASTDFGCHNMKAIDPDSASYISDNAQTISDNACLKI